MCQNVHRSYKNWYENWRTGADHAWVPCFQLTPLLSGRLAKAMIILKTASTGWKLKKHPIHFTELDIAKDSSPQIIEWWTIGECFVECIKSMTTSKLLRVFYSNFSFLQLCNEFASFAEMGHTVSVFYGDVIYQQNKKWGVNMDVACFWFN